MARCHVTYPAIAARYHMMAENGENTEERPMWAERGGLDFEGRAKWDAWTALKGMKADRAKLEFVRVSSGPNIPAVKFH